MFFDSVSSALYMDGHGVFVWPAYAITLIVIIMLLVVPKRRERKLMRQLEGQYKRQPNLQHSAADGSRRAD